MSCHARYIHKNVDLQIFIPESVRGNWQSGDLVGRLSRPCRRSRRNDSGSCSEGRGSCRRPRLPHPVFQKYNNHYFKYGFRLDPV